jgi:biotin synthase
MCLTIPAQIIKLGRNQAIIRDSNTAKTVNISLISNLKIGDWILYISDLAVKKISKNDAQEISILLKSPQKIDTQKLDARFRSIIEASRIRNLTKKEVVYLLNIDGPEKKALFSEANIIRKTYLKDFICIHGIIEFSNYCRNDCLYCGLRKENQKLKRYRMSVDEIIETAQEAVNKKGYKLLVLQSGEDSFYTEEILCKIIKEIKKRCRVFIFMSVGERGCRCYQKMKQAGASGVLFRFETSNPVLFKKLHPKGKDFKSRFKHLEFMKKLGYFIATGSLIGLPGQTTEDLADDILTIKEWANMVSIGPFIPTQDTSLTDAFYSEKPKKWKAEMNFKMIAILRLLMPTIRIPVVTALETAVGEEGRRKALWAGANSLMFNLTPAKYRPFYKIYDHKFFQKENLWEKYGLFKNEESYKMLEERMQKELKR